MILSNAAFQALVSCFLPSDLPIFVKHNGNNKRIMLLSNDSTIFIMFYYACVNRFKFSLIAISLSYDIQSFSELRENWKARHIRLLTSELADRKPVLYNHYSSDNNISTSKHHNIPPLYIVIFCRFNISINFSGMSDLPVKI